VKKDLVKLEQQLQADICNSDAAVLERVNELVRRHLYWCIGEVTGRRITKPEQVDELMQLHTKAALMKRLIEEPHKFTTKDLKDLFKAHAQVAQESGPQKADNIVAAISALNIPDSEKKRMLEKAMAAVGSRAAAELGRG